MIIKRKLVAIAIVLDIALIAAAGILGYNYFTAPDCQVDPVAVDSNEWDDLVAEGLIECDSAGDCWYHPISTFQQQELAIDCDTGGVDCYYTVNTQ